MLLTFEILVMKWTVVGFGLNRIGLVNSWKCIRSEGDHFLCHNRQPSLNTKPECGEDYISIHFVTSFLLFLHLYPSLSPHKTLKKKYFETLHILDYVSLGFLAR